MQTICVSILRPVETECNTLYKSLSFTPSSVIHMICSFDSPPTMHAAAADGLLNVIFCSFMGWTSDSANDPGSCLYLAAYFAAFSITALSALLCGLFSSSAPPNMLKNRCAGADVIVCTYPRFTHVFASISTYSPNLARPIPSPQEAAIAESPCYMRISAASPICA